MSEDLKRFVILTGDAGRDILRRAIELRNAMDGVDDPSTQVSDGDAIVAIVRDWRDSETARMRGMKGG